MRLGNDAEEVKKMLTELIVQHSSIRRWNDNSRNNGIFILAGDYCWNELSPEGKQLQSCTLKNIMICICYLNFL